MKDLLDGALWVLAFAGITFVIWQNHQMHRRMDAWETVHGIVDGHGQPPNGGPPTRRRHLHRVPSKCGHGKSTASAAVIITLTAAAAALLLVASSPWTSARTSTWSPVALPPSITVPPAVNAPPAAPAAPPARSPAAAQSRPAVQATASPRRSARSQPSSTPPPARPVPLPAQPPDVPAAPQVPAVPPSGLVPVDVHPLAVRIPRLL